MTKIRIKRVFIKGRSLYFVYIGTAFVYLLTKRPHIDELRNLIGHMTWGTEFRNSSLKFLNEIAVEKYNNTEEDS